MADYQKMYAILCKAIDNVIDPLEQIPEAKKIAKSLHTALLEAEEIYIDSTPYFEESDASSIIKLYEDKK